MSENNSCWSEIKIENKKIKKKEVETPQNKNKKGRKPKQIQQRILSNYGFICQDFICKYLVELFTKQGQVRIIQKTNQKNFIESKRIINDQLESQPKYYFLSLEDNSNYIINEIGQLQDINEYRYIDEMNYPFKFRSLIKKINLCFPLLETDFINDLSQLLTTYIDCYHQYQDPYYSADLLAQDIRESLEFSYLKQWSQAKSLSRDTQFQISLFHLEQENQKNKNRKSQKPKQKTDNLIVTLQNEIDEEKKFQPLEYFIFKLVQIFESEMAHNQNEDDEIQYDFYE